MTRSVLLRSTIIPIVIALATACSPPAPAPASPEPTADIAKPTIVANPVLACSSASTLKSDVTKEGLIAIYGAANVTEETLPWADSTETAVVLFAGIPDMRVELLWLDKTSGGPRIIQTDSAKWTGPLGLHTGASMADVEAANGAPISLMGFSNHNSGEANDFHGGKLDAGDKGCRVTLIFATPEDLPPEVAAPVNNDPEKVYNSDGPEMRAAKPFLATIVLSYFDPS
ncbi:MAG: hypothetical protein ABMA14_03925 [Hyphomonadaceae bacterium]